MPGILILLSILHVSLSEDASYPDINDLFPSSNHTTANISSYAASFDIGNIDVNRLKTRMDAFNASAEEVPRDTRRQVLAYSFLGKTWYRDASNHMTRQKTLDLMLQTIYMARNILRELESNPNFNNKDTGYRIGYLYRKLRKMLKKMNDIFSMMHKNIWVWRNVERHLKLHHKAVAVHTDFMYYWWVLIKVDGKFRDANSDYPKLPKSLSKIGGLSAEKFPIG